MEFLERFYVFDVLHAIGQVLIIPVVAVLFAFLCYVIYSVGTIIIEGVSERKIFKVDLPRLVAQLEDADYDALPEVIARSGLLINQRVRLLELTRYMYLPEDALTEVAKRLLYDQNLVYQKQVAKTDVVSKVAPMFGLMGTLIPLGPGIVALAGGDTATLSQSLMVAFDTTIVGLIVAAVSFIISRIRKRWYADYLVSLEGCFNTLLEKSRLLHEAGYPFEKTVGDEPINSVAAARRALAKERKSAKAGKAGESEDAAASSNPESSSSPSPAAEKSPAPAAAAQLEPEGAS